MVAKNIKLCHLLIKMNISEYPKYPIEEGERRRWMLYLKPSSPHSSPSSHRSWWTLILLRIWQYLWRHKKHWGPVFCSTTRQHLFDPVLISTQRSHPTNKTCIKRTKCSTNFCGILTQLTWSESFGNLCVQRISRERDFELGSFHHLASDYLREGLCDDVDVSVGLQW